ncbi:MAG TPA: peptidoglycan DD-metalloendopeptidase family protein [Polyangiaceae bacterium]|nr:peptidoglycan DD-metalloendopeptidase family protein [Polyangiaceae bacterium]
MAPAGDPPPRHVGRVIDPSVRDDSGQEPTVELEPTPDESPAASRASELPRGERLRALLIQRAEAARGRAPAPPSAPPSAPEPTFGDLDAIGRVEAPQPSRSAPSRAPSAPWVLPESRFSPNVVFALGTLVGMAIVGALVGVSMALSSLDDAPAPVASAAPPPSAAPPAPPPRPKRVREKLPSPWRIADARNEEDKRIIEGVVGNNTFLAALDKVGIPTRQSYRILTAMKGVKDLDRCGRSDRFILLLDKKGSRIRAFEYVVSDEEVYQAREDEQGLLKGTRLDLKVERQQITGAFVLDGASLDAHAQAAGFEDGLSRVVARALEGHLGVEELERGDRLRVIAQEVTVLGEFVRYAGVEAIEVRRANESRPPLRIYYFDVPAERGHYDADGRAPYEGGWRKPIKDAPVTSPFNLRRRHPVLKRVMPHLGIDFGAPTGTPVGASSYGKVSFIGYSGPSGNLVKVRHPGGIETGYAHLSRFAAGLRVGDRVRRLQVIGYVGSTGRSTGPHLHFSASRNGKYFDPSRLNLDGMRTISRANREAFRSVKERYDALLDAIPLPSATSPTMAALLEPEPSGMGGGDDDAEALDDSALEGEALP